MSVLVRIALVAAPLGLAACADSLPSVPERDIAYNVLAIQPNGAGDGYVLRPTSLFFRTNQLDLLQSSQAPNLCEDRTFVPRSPAVTDTFPTVTYLDAGSTIALSSTGGTAATLVSTTDGYGKSYYAPSGNSPVAPFTPGDVVTLNVPGGAAGGNNIFPAVALTHATVTPFTFDSVSLKSNDPDGLKITWSPPPSPPTGSAVTGMLVSLRYAAVGSGSPDHEVFCSLADDGSFVIPIESASGWFKSLATGQHQTVFTRWRGEVRQHATNRYSSVVSTIVETTPTAPPAP
jgi:hypothetical protein